MRGLLLLILFFVINHGAKCYPYVFERLESGESLDLINDIYRDHKGYLWIATTGVGIVKHSGNDVISYRSEEKNETTISSSFVNVILEDSRNNLWIGTTNGLNRYNRKKDNFERYKIANDLTDNETGIQVRDIQEDKTGNLWIAHNKGVTIYNIDKGKSKTYSHGNTEFCSITEDKEGRIWVAATNETGLFSFDKTTGLFTHFGKEQDIFKGIAKKLFTDKDGRLWLGERGNGLSEFIPSKGTFNIYPYSGKGNGTNNRIVRDILDWNKDTLIIATDQGGMNIFDKQSGKFSYILDSTPGIGTITSNGINCMFYDHEQILWLGTARGGVNYYNPHKQRFTTYKRSSIENTRQSVTNIVTCFHEDIKGRIWIGTDGGGLSIYDRKTTTFRHIPYSAQETEGIETGVVRSICEDKDHNLWIANYPAGLSMYDIKREKLVKPEFYKKRQAYFRAHNLWSMYIDQKNRKWFSSADGTITLFDENDNQMAVEFIYKSNPMHHLSEFREDAQGRIYINGPDGIYRYNENKVRMERIVWVNDIICFELINNEHLAIGTFSKGLFISNMHGNILKHYTKERGLADNYICAIEPVRDSILWISTVKGVSRGDMKTDQFSNYYEVDGLQDNQFFNQSSLRARNGEILFGGVNGFSMFHPWSFELNTQIPTVYIEEVMLLMDKKHNSQQQPRSIKGINSGDTIRLAWWDNFLKIKFGATSFTYPLKCKYAYKLDGLEPNWNIIESTNRVVSYSNLEAGNYCFKVKVSNNDQKWGTEETQFVLIIEPPFWLTSWFYALCIIFGASLIYLYLKVRLSRLKKEKSSLQEKVLKRTEIIQKQNDKLITQRNELLKHREQLEDLVFARTEELVKAKDKAEESDRLKSAFLANMSHEIRTPMNAIVGFSLLLDDDDISKQERHEYVNIITHNADTLLYLIEDILDFSMIEANKLSIHHGKFAFNDLIDNIYSSYALRNTNENVEVTINNQLSEIPLVLESDSFRVRQIINNLMNNALKWTDTGFIELCVKKDDKFIHIIVKDSGKGIDADKLEGIFNLFVKIEEDSNKIRRGVGLGLTISQRLAQLLGGNIKVKSTPGQGSEFTFELPIEKNISVDE